MSDVVRTEGEAEDGSQDDDAFDRVLTKVGGVVEDVELGAVVVVVRAGSSSGASVHKRTTR